MAPVDAVKRLLCRLTMQMTTTASLREIALPLYEKKNENVL
jgi:hypothetical protein